MLRSPSTHCLSSWLGISLLPACFPLCIGNGLVWPGPAPLCGICPQQDWGLGGGEGQPRSSRGEGAARAWAPGGRTESGARSEAPSSCFTSILTWRGSQCEDCCWSLRVLQRGWQLCLLREKQSNNHHPWGEHSYRFILGPHPLGPGAMCSPGVLCCSSAQPDRRKTFIVPACWSWWMVLVDTDNQLVPVYLTVNVNVFVNQVLQLQSLMSFCVIALPVATM